LKNHSTFIFRSSSIKDTEGEDAMIIENNAAQPLLIAGHLYSTDMAKCNEGFSKIMLI